MLKTFSCGGKCWQLNEDLYCSNIEHVMTAGRSHIFKLATPAVCKTKWWAFVFEIVSADHSKPDKNTKQPPAAT